jgi:hypothetical protein
MTEIYDQIKKQVAKGLNVRVEDLKKITRSDSTKSSFQIGDQIEFSLYARNDNPFDLSDLNFHIHEMSAVKLEVNPVKAEIQELSQGEEKFIVSLKGKIVGNPNDVISPWTKMDSLCRVKMAGKILLSPIPFEDVEIETINVVDN